MSRKIVLQKWQKDELKELKQAELEDNGDVQLFSYENYGLGEQTSTFLLTREESQKLIDALTEKEEL